MDIRALIGEIDKVKQIVSSWSCNNNIPEIERGIALDKLKYIYECLLSVSLSEVTMQEVPVPTVPAIEDTPRDTPPQYEAEVSQAIGDPVAVASDTVYADTSYASDPTPGTPMDQKLFCNDQVVRQRVDKQAILSLYGDTPTPPCPIHPTHPVANQTPSPVAPPVSDMASGKKVLGDAFNNTANVAMNEALGKQQAPHTDMASKLHANSAVKDLHQSIGINDRFMLIRSLFNSDGELYNTTLNQLNTFTDLDEAILYIQENYNWDPDHEGVRLIVDLLERKLG